RRGRHVVRRTVPVAIGAGPARHALGVIGNAVAVAVARAGAAVVKVVRIGDPIQVAIGRQDRRKSKARIIYVHVRDQTVRIGIDRAIDAPVAVAVEGGVAALGYIQGAVVIAVQIEKIRRAVVIGVEQRVVARAGIRRAL